MSEQLFGEPVEETPMFGVPADDTPLFGEPVEEESDRTQSGDIARGIGAGVVDIAQGISELAALGVDLVADTDYATSVSDFFTEAKDTMGLDPETTAGRAAESITNFAGAFIPIAGWLGRAGQAARGVRAAGQAGRFGRSAEAFGRTNLGRALTGTRLRLAGTTTLAGGVSDFFVSPDGTGTLADAFDAMPDLLETEERSGLTGRDEAFRRLRNKLRVGAEGTAFGAAAEALFPVARGAATAISRTPGVPQAARFAVQGLEKAAQFIGQLPGGARAQRLLTSAGAVPQRLFLDLESTEAFIETATREAENALVEFDRAAAQFAPNMFQRIRGRGRAGMDAAYEDLLRYLQGADDALEEYGQSVITPARRMRDQITRLSDTIATQVRNSDIPQAQKTEILETFQRNTGGYLRRLYRRFEDPNWVVSPSVVGSPEYNRAIGEVQDILQRMDDQAVTRGDLVQPRSADELRADAESEVARLIGLDAMDVGLTPEAAARSLSRNLQAGQRAVQRGGRPLYALAEGILSRRSKSLEGAPALRALMGEITDPRELYLRTVGDMAKFSVTQELYQQTARNFARTGAEAVQQANAGGRPLIIAGEGADDVGSRLGYTQLTDTRSETLFGGTFGALNGAWVAPEIYKALTTPQMMTQGILNELLAVSLQAKGVAQEMVTVYSPIAQIRNFLSNIFVTLANGNVMRDLPFGDSFRLTAGKAANLDNVEFRDLFEIAGRLGLREQNLQVQEFRRLMEEGSHLGVAGRIQTGARAIKDRIPFATALERVYSGTDTFWKITNWMAERAKYGNAFRRAGINPENIDDVAELLVGSGLGSRTSELTGTAGFIDTLAGDIVRNTTPTYSRVPEAIRNLRRIPFVGNFVAFPAEIIRNSANIVDQGLRELGFRASPELVQRLRPEGARMLERQIRAIGAQRIAGYITSATVIPMGMQAAARDILGWSPEQAEALNMMAPYYLEGHQLVPLTPAGDPNVEYIDLSYMMPYDFMLVPARAALQAYAEQGQVDAGTAQTIREMAFSGLGKLFEPFASESLLAERVYDVTLRGGSTRTGQEVFNRSTPFGERLSRGLTHVVGAYIPGAAQLFVQERGGELSAGRLTRAITGAPSAAGQPYDVAEELGAIVTGLRPMHLRLPETFRYAGFEYNQARRDASNIFGREANANDSTEESVLDAYRQANDQLLRHQARLYAQVRAARELGMTDAQIRRELRDQANLGREEVAMIMRGRFRPLELSDERIRSVVREGRNEARVIQRLPVREIRQLYREYRRMDIPEQMPEQPMFGEPVSAPQGQMFGEPVDQQGAAQTAPATYQAPAPAGPQPLQAPARATPPIDLLGDNPIEALRNLQIAQRFSSSQ